MLICVGLTFSTIMSRLGNVRRRLRLKYMLPLLAISIFSLGSFAASVIVTQTTLQAQNGVYFNVIGGFTGASNGFNVVQATAAASAQPCTWANGGTCATAVTAGRWQYSFTLTLNAAATASTTYTLTVTWNTGAGYSTLGTLTVTTLASITAGQTMTFLLDTGGTTFTAPAGITITVA
jgi:hypothetical protein